MERIYIIKESIVYGEYDCSAIIYREIPTYKKCCIENFEVIEKLPNGDCIVRSEGEIIKIKSKDVFIKYEDAAKKLKIVQKKLSTWNKEERKRVEKREKDCREVIRLEPGIDFFEEKEVWVGEIFLSVIMIAGIIVFGTILILGLGG